MINLERKKRPRTSTEMLMLLSSTIMPGVYSLPNYGNLIVDKKMPGRETLAMEVFTFDRNILNTGQNGWNSHRLEISKWMGMKPQMTEVTRTIWNRGKRGKAIELTNEIFEETNQEAIDMGIYINPLSRPNSLQQLYDSDIPEISPLRSVTIGKAVNDRISTLLTLARQHMGLSITTSGVPANTFFRLLTIPTTADSRDTQASYGEFARSNENAKYSIGNQDFIEVSCYTGAVRINSVTFNFAGGEQKNFSVEPDQTLMRNYLRGEKVISNPALPEDCICVVQELDDVIASPLLVKEIL